MEQLGLSVQQELEVPELLQVALEAQHLLHGPVKMARTERLEQQETQDPQGRELRPEVRAE